MLYHNHENATKVRNLLSTEISEPRKIDPIRALTFLLDNELTAAEYSNTRLLSKEYGADIFPPYYKLVEAKKDCRPVEKCKVNDVYATLPLQQLMNHTAHRLLLLQEEVIRRYTEQNNNNLSVMLQAKWGGDGSADHSQYNQKYANVESAGHSDANFFATTLVPLRITSTDNNEKAILWNNVTPQSSRIVDLCVCILLKRRRNLR